MSRSRMNPPRPGRPRMSQALALFGWAKPKAALVQARALELRWTVMALHQTNLLLISFEKTNKKCLEIVAMRAF